jgi:hypothetical protein
VVWDLGIFGEFVVSGHSTHFDGLSGKNREVLVVLRVQAYKLVDSL